MTKLGPTIRINKDIVSTRRTRLGTIVLAGMDIYFFKDIEDKVWSRIDGKKIKDIINELCPIYDVGYNELQNDVTKFISELENAKLIRYVCK